MKYSICIENFYKALPLKTNLPQPKGMGLNTVSSGHGRIGTGESVKKAIADSGIKIAAFSGDDEYSLVNPDENSLYIDFLRRSIEKAREIHCSYLVIHSDALNQDGSAKEIDKPLSYEVKLLNMYQGP